MLKTFRRSDISTTPFVATKPWVLTSFLNDDLVLIEEKPDEIPVAQEFIDYQNSGTPAIYNQTCNIALEQQDLDKVLYEEGQKIEGRFDPTTDPINNTGTYKRLLYTQIRNAFYNEYNNPTQMFGMEHLDFQLSKIRKFLTNEFRLFNIPQINFGEKMLENTILLIDNSLDDNFQITDDGNGNIVAKKNLFSRVQEVGDFENIYVSGTSGISCDPPVTTTTTTTTTTTPPPTTTTTTTTTTSTTTTTTTPTTTTTTTTTTPTTTTTTTTTTPTTTTTTTTSTLPPPTTTTAAPPTTLPPPTTTTAAPPTTLAPISSCNPLDCDYFSNTLIPVVHWSATPSIECNCACSHGTCDERTTCITLRDLDVYDPISNPAYIIVDTRNGTPDCTQAIEDPLNPGTIICIPGSGRNLPSRYLACFVPVLDVLTILCPDYEFVVSAIPPTEPNYSPCQGNVIIIKTRDPNMP